MPRNRHYARNIENSHNQARTDLLTEARQLIIRAQNMGIGTPTSLVSIQHDIERALRNERRARRNREQESEPPGAEVEQVAAAVVDRDGRSDENMTAAEEAEAERAEREDIRYLATEEPQDGTIADTTTAGPAVVLLEIVGEIGWQAQEWD
jgi:hypothetical protein